jgi:isopentenyl-diphosphate delta-isomerase
MPAVSDEMIIDAVDRGDRPVETVKRGDVFALRANFRVAHVLVFDHSGQLLIQRLAGTRERHPLMWGSSVACYLFSGESYHDAAARRLPEELGLSGPLRWIGKTSMNDNSCEKFIGVFSAILDGPFNIDRSHISDIKFISLEDIGRAIHMDSMQFTPTFLKVLAFYKSTR